MAVYFPQVNGITTTLPWSYQDAFDTLGERVPSGQFYGTSRLDEPLGRWALNLAEVPDAMRTAVRDFYLTQGGALRPFTFLHPSGNLIPYSEDFSNAAWAKTSITVGSAQADPFGGTLALRLTGGASNSYLQSVFLPDGDALTVTAGDPLWFCFSVWVRPTAAPQNLEISFQHSGGSSAVVFPLVSSAAWRRISHAWQADTDNALSVRLGGSSSWGSGASIDVFGAQVTPLLGPGIYSKTPGNAGLRHPCYFENGPIAFRAIGPQQNIAQVVIEQYVA